jgi:hypothetical protein
MNPNPDEQSIKKHLRGYFLLFAVQLVGIALVVAASLAGLPRTTVGATIVLLLASVFGGFLLHQIGRRKTLNATFLLTGFLLVMLMLLTLVAFYDRPMVNH